MILIVTMSIASFLVTTMTDSGFSNHSSSYCPSDLRSMTSPWNTTTKIFRSVDRCGLHHPSQHLGASFGTLCYLFAINCLVFLIRNKLFLIVVVGVGGGGGGGV